MANKLVESGRTTFECGGQKENLAAYLLIHSQTWAASVCLEGA